MKAVILAAGIGSRLRPMTNDKPKTLVEVNGKPMLGHIIDALLENSVKNIVICVGFNAEMVVNFCKTTYADVDFDFVINTEYNQTNNMYSLYLAKNFLNDDMLLMNADLVFDAEVIARLLKQPQTSVAVDKGNYIEESMKIAIANESIVHISKSIDPQESYGSSIDVYKINKKDVEAIKEEMAHIIEERRIKNQWTEVMLDNLFSNKRIDAKPMDIGELRWHEIDNYEDLAAAELKFNEHLKDLKNRKIYFLDNDGTLTIEGRPLNGVSDFINSLKSKGKIFYILTNNSSKTIYEHLENLKKAGISAIEEDNVLVSTQSALEYLRTKGVQKLYWVANQSVSSYLQKEGFIYEEAAPDAILLTYDTEITYAKFRVLTKLVRSGTPYYATHLDIVCPSPDGPVPDIGTYIKVVEMTTGLLPNRIFGKPDKNFIEPILRKHGLTPNDAVIIGDRLYTDIALGKESGATSILTLTGETTREMYESDQIRCDIVTPSIDRLIGYI